MDMFNCENKKAPDSSRIKWRVTYQISPAFNIFFYMMMAFYCFNIYLNDYAYFKDNVELFDKFLSNNAYHLFLSLLSGFGFATIIGYFLKNSFNSAIPLPSLKQQILYIISEQEDADRFARFQEKYPDTEWTAINYSDRLSIKDIVKYNVCISSVSIGTEMEDQLDGYSVYYLDFSKYDSDKNIRLEDFLKATAFKQNALATLANIAKRLCFFIEVAFYRTSKGVDYILMNDTFRIAIILFFLGISVSLSYISFSNEVYFKMMLIGVISCVKSIFIFNVFFLLLFQMDNVAILISNLMTEMIPYAKLYVIMSKLDNRTSFKDWYYEYLDKFLIGDSEAQPMKYIKSGEWFYVIASMTIMLFANLTRLLFQAILVPFLGSLTVKTVYKMIYIPMMIVMILLMIIQYIISSYLFTYALVFFVCSLIIGIISAILFESSLSFLITSALASDLLALEKLVLITFGIGFLILSMFLGQNVLSVLQRTGSYNYYFGVGNQDGVLQKMLFNWREGVYLTQIKASLWTGLVCSFILISGYIVRWKNNEYPNLQLSAITSFQSTLRLKVKNYELNPSKFRANLNKDIDDLKSKFLPERWKKQLEEADSVPTRQKKK